MNRLWLGVVLVASLCASCGREPAQRPQAGGKVKVFVTVLPEAYFVHRIGGEHVEVEALVGPGQNPHTFEVKPKQMATLAECQLYFSIGFPMEDSLLKKLSEINADLKVVDVRKDITLLRTEQEGLSEGEPHGGPVHSEEEFDPHVWMNPRLVKLMASTICDELKAVDPAHADDYTMNLRAFHADLDQTDEEIGRELAPLKGKSFMVFHPAFGYFAQAYGLRQVAIEVEGKEPSARQLAAIIDLAKKNEVRVVFVEPQFSTKSAEAIARQVGAALVPIDPQAYDYLKNLKDTADKIRQAIEQPKSL